MNEAEMKAKADAEAEEKRKADAARADEAPPWAKKLADSVGACMSRMDSMESLIKSDKRADGTTEPAETAADKAKADRARADAEEEKKEEKKEADKARADAEEEKNKADAEKEEKERADKARADAEEKKKEEEREKADAARADSVSKVMAENADIKKQLAALTGAVHISDDDRAVLSQIQARADSVASAFGRRASVPMAGESPLAYRRRLALGYKDLSEKWKATDLAILPDQVLAIAEADIYADALTAASHPADLPAGQLREIINMDRTGRKVSTFVGAKSAWMDQFKAPAQLQVRINKEFH